MATCSDLLAVILFTVLMYSSLYSPCGSQAPHVWSQYLPSFFHRNDDSTGGRDPSSRWRNLFCQEPAEEQETLLLGSCCRCCCCMLLPPLPPYIYTYMHTLEHLFTLPFSAYFQRIWEGRSQMHCIILYCISCCLKRFVVFLLLICYFKHRCFTTP